MERLFLEMLKPVFDSQLLGKQAGFGHSPCITDQVSKLTYDVEHRFEENSKLGVVLADLTAAHDSQLYDTKTKYPTTAFDLLFLL